MIFFPHTHQYFLFVYINDRFPRVFKITDYVEGSGKNLVGGKMRLLSGNLDGGGISSFLRNQLLLIFSWLSEGILVLWTWTNYF